MESRQAQGRMAYCVERTYINLYFKIRNKYMRKTTSFCLYPVVLLLPQLFYRAWRKRARRGFRGPGILLAHLTPGREWVTLN